MGRQLGFYLLKEEENLLLQEIFGIAERIVDDTGADILPWNNNISNQYYIVSKEGKLIYYAGDSKYFNDSTSDVIQFCRTKYYTKRGAEPGRIWTELRYWDKEENLITKDKALDDLYKQIVKMIKKRTTKLKDSPYYISQSAQEYIQANDLTIN